MDANPVYVFARWQVKEGQLDAIWKLLPEVAEKSRKEEGNLFYKIHQSRSDSNTLVLFEGYKDEVAWEAHRNSSHFQRVVVQQIIPLLEGRDVQVTTEVG